MLFYIRSMFAVPEISRLYKFCKETVVQNAFKMKSPLCYNSVRFLENSSEVENAPHTVAVHFSFLIGDGSIRVHVLKHVLDFETPSNCLSL